jgi:non-specific serine/threonine protein kinase
MSPLLVGDLSSRYRIERLIARGGMASVYLAHDVRHSRQVAVKLIAEDTSTALDHQRFVREIAIVARLNHPHLVPLFDSGIAGGRPYYVMPYLAEGSLRERLSRDHRLSLEDTVRLACEIASGLGHAHQAGLVHRDIKPENVLLTSGIAQIADFGIARLRADATVLLRARTDPGSLTGTRFAIGTPTYMAPEQILGRDIDPRADLYALACVVYEMLAGRPPFVAENQTALLSMHLSAIPAPVTEFRSGIPTAIGEVLGHALAKAASNRYASAAELAETLTLAARTRAPLAGPTAAATTPHNLPRTPSRFIGRTEELAGCRRLLDTARLLTVTGMGGSGKTRLALRFAEVSLPDHPDGVWFVDLAPTREADRVPQVMATAIAISPSPGVPITDQIVAALAGSNALVILDNCEHVLGAASTLVQALLAGCHSLRVMATSREALRIPGEKVLKLPSLAVPAGNDLPSVNGSDAARLFEDRARAVEPDFALTDENATPVAEICRRLDGIPLAIELAAARTNVLSVIEIRDRLDDRFRLLTSGPRTSLPRHKTLAAAMEWSYDLLSPDEQRLFRSLSVFAGGCTLAAVAAVAGPEVDEFAALDLLSRLADKSLIDVRRLSDGSTRYFMLETVWRFARTRLEQSPEFQETRDRHLDHYLAFVEEADRNVRGPDTGRWLSRLDQVRENLLAAHDWCHSAPSGAQKGLRLQAALRNYWRNMNLLDLGLRLSEEALARPGADAPTRPRADLLSRMSLLSIGLGQHERALTWAKESVVIARQLDDPHLLAFSLLNLGAAHGVVQDYAAALDDIAEAIPIAERIGDKLMLSALLNNLGELHRIRGEFDAAERAYDRALACSREIGRVEGVATGLVNVGYVLIPRGRLDEARVHLLEALRLCRDHHLEQRTLTSLDLVLALAAARGDAAFAAELWSGVEELRERTHTHRDPQDEAFVRGWHERARTASGAENYERATAHGRECTLEDMLAASLAWLEKTTA